MGGASRVVVAHGVGGVMGSTWGATEVVGTTRGAIKVDEAGDKVATHGLVV
jgi:hypothetical protein